LKRPVHKTCDRFSLIDNPCNGKMMNKPELLSVAEMYAADKAAMARGISGESLMEAAGEGVFSAISERFPVGRAAVLCGPGNNGGDGFVVARLLAAAGWQVRLGLVGSLDDLAGDAATMAARWEGQSEALAPDVIADADIIVDAIFGAGLSRDVDGVAGNTLRAVAANPAPCVAIDIPSGINGDTGKVQGYAASATLTVTFFRAKTGHYLMPGRSLRGELVVVDIGIPESVLTTVQPQAALNGPGVWLDIYPLPVAGGHKFMRGHVVVDSGGVSTTGAARLAAMAALRAGAGLVTISCPKSALLVLASHLTAIMVQAVDSLEEFQAFLPTRKHNVALLGPGNGVGEVSGPRTRERTLAALASGLGCVLDADALSCFADNPEQLFEAIDGHCTLTPHDGEFARLFDVGEGAAKHSVAKEAAEKSAAVVIHKGADTVIASPDGRTVINSNAPAWLATAGSGDVLAGFAASLLAQGMPPFEAACAAVWLHGECAASFGPGLIAEDLPEMVPSVLQDLWDIV
jgi:ADP-dependent NAD(P)H-hydrate dehydratase / NAD(P)H-hydrate epimerase